MDKHTGTINFFDIGCDRFYHSTFLAENLLKDVKGEILEVGVGTGANLITIL